MSGFSYDKAKVQQSIDNLTNISDKIAKIAPEIQSGLNTIKNANGINYINWNQSSVENFVQECNDILEDLITSLKNQVASIESYKEGKEGSFFKRLGATLVMTGSKLAEGIGTFFENIVDGCASIVGFVGGIFSSKFRDSVAEFVAKDHVGDWFNKQYTSDNKFSVWVDKYSWMSYDSTAANVFKGVGTALPEIALSFIPGVGPALSIGAAGLSGAGSKMQSELQSGTGYNQAFGKSLVAGGVDAAISTVFNATKLAAGGEGGKVIDGVNKVKGGIKSGAQKGINGVKNVAKKFVSKTKLDKVASKVANSKAGKVVINAGKKIGSKAKSIATKIPGVKSIKKVGSKIKDVGTKVTGSVKNAAKTVLTNPKYASIAAAGTVTAYTYGKTKDTIVASENNAVNQQFSADNATSTQDLPVIEDPSVAQEPTPDPETDNTGDTSGDTNSGDSSTSTGESTSSSNMVEYTPQMRKTASSVAQSTTTEPSTSGGQSSTTEPSTSGDQSSTTEPSTGGDQSNITEPSTGGDQSNITEPSTGDDQSNITEPSTGGNQSNITEPSTGDDQSNINQPSNNGGEQTQQPSNNPPSNNNYQPSNSNYQPSNSNYQPSNNGNSYGDYTDTSYTPNTDTTQTPDDTIEILDDGTGNETTTPDTTDTTNDPYEEDYVVEPPVDTPTSKTTKKSMAGPILTGVGLAGAAGVGAKVYLDRKKENESGEYDETVDTDNSIMADEWNDDSNSSYEDNSSDYDSDSSYGNSSDGTSDYEYPVD